MRVSAGLVCVCPQVLCACVRRSSVRVCAFVFVCVCVADNDRYLSAGPETGKSGEIR